MKQKFLFCLIGIIAAIASCSQVAQLKNDAIDAIMAGRFADAIQTYKAIWQIDKNNPENLNNLGWAYLRNEGLEVAEHTFEKALGLAPREQLDTMIRTNLSLTRDFLKFKALLQNNQCRAALDTLKHVTANFQLKEIAYKYLARCYECLGEPDSARANWEEIVKLYVNSDVRNHYYFLAKEKMLTIASERIDAGDFKDALGIYEMLLSVEKADPALQNSLAWALFRTEEWKEAKRILEKASTIALSKAVEDSIETNLFMVMTFLSGEYSLREKDYEAALVEFEKVTARYASTDIGLKYLALCYEGAGKKDKARMCWQRILKMYQNMDFYNSYKDEKYVNEYVMLANKKLYQVKDL
ncbi:tetratricopeptide repeat protein [candidate division KSB1 bacterium]|nr:tetratricopeptide repeat protein [candidate division KSB1 bacterium]